MPIANLAPNDRYALVGKTGSGKTALAMVLAGTMARALLSDPRWQVWWIDTKGDKRDLASLRQWGFRNVATEQDYELYGGTGNAFYWLVPRRTKDGHNIETVDYAQRIIAKAYDRKYVVLVIDEYVSVVVSAREPGTALKDVFQRGRGLNVGLIGLTQEPVYVPRQLISQASHLVMLSLTYGHDIKYMKTLEPIYEVPSRRGDRYGFWWKDSDGNGEVTYYPNQQAWYDSLQISLPNVAQPTA